MTPVLLALLGIAGTLGGVVVGGWNERRRWLRDKRLEAYSQFIGAVNEWTLAYGRAGRVTEALNDEMRALVDAGQRVRLLGPDAVARKLIEVTDVVFEIMAVIEAEGTTSVARNRPRLEDMNMAQFELVALAQTVMQGRRPRLRRGGS